MKIYFLRHGKADWPEWTGDDDERPLTSKGKKEMRKVAAFLTDAGVEPALILSSPLPRALQTAEIAAKELGVKVVKQSSLALGFGVRQLNALLRGYPDRDVMLVGHEPSFSQTIRSLTGGAVKMAKGGVACVNVVTGMTGGELLWLITPKLCGA